MSGGPERDEELGAALRDLEVPPHGPEFYSTLIGRLEQAENEGAPTAGDDAPAGEMRRQRRRPRDAGRRRGGRPRLVVLGSVAAAVAVAVLLASWLVAPNDRGPGVLRPQVASASEVRTRVAQALAGAKTLQGEVRVECAVPVGDCEGTPQAHGVLASRFATTARGDLRVTAVEGGSDLAYRADTGVEHSYTPGQRPPAFDRVGLAPAPPDAAPTASVLDRQFGSAVRAFLASRADVPVTQLNQDGRPAWRLDTRVEPNKLAGPGQSGDRLEVVVDRASGFPVLIRETNAGAFIREIRLTGLTVDAAIEPAIFELQYPPGTGRPGRQEGRFRRVGLQEVAAVVGYQPLVPAKIPAGFELAEVAVASASQPTGQEGLNPESRNVVSLTWRRGFDRMTVTTRATGPDRSAWSDPLGSGEGFIDTPEKISLDGGALNGAPAEVLVQVRDVPHLWVLSDRLVVTVAGDLTRDELVAAAQSL